MSGAPAVPSASQAAPEAAPDDESPEPPAASSPCPEEMVFIRVAKPFCIDRWEAILVDKNNRQRLSPYYPVNRKLALKLETDWDKKRLELGPDKARSMPCPQLPAWQREADAVPMAMSRANVVPNGYVSGVVAKQACENAGKRLCRHDEWVRACRGEDDQPFPYGETYKPNACNVFRATHPAAELHGNASIGHLDPRLNLVSDKQGPLLQPTGTTKSCQSRWGTDAVYDMVGNLDEWVDDPEGLFVGGFFSRSKKDGCASAVRNHPTNYFDYSLGVRCCKDAL